MKGDIIPADVQAANAYMVSAGIVLTNSQLYIQFYHISAYDIQITFPHQHELNVWIQVAYKCTNESLELFSIKMFKFNYLTEVCSLS